MAAQDPAPTPLIGITCSRSVGGAWGVYDRGHFMNYAYSDYCQAVAACGGAAVIVPADQAPGTLAVTLKRLDGLILSGGPDLHPRTYGEDPRPGLGEVDDLLDRMELEAARLALDGDLPLLGICRGIQVLNVACGGTVYQDILRQVEGAIQHAPAMDKSVHSHTVALEPGTRLAALLGEETVWVNGKHHQAIRTPGKGLKVVARAGDGVVEAVEREDRRFVLAVQWHPEGSWRSDRHARALFQGLVDAAGGGSFKRHEPKRPHS